MKRYKPAVTIRNSSRVFGYSLSYFANKPLRRLLASAGALPRLGWPGAKDVVLVWGRTKTSGRGQWVAKKTGAKPLFVEDGFLRSVKTGRDGDPSVSLILDETGIYFETDAPNDLANMLQNRLELSAVEVDQTRSDIDYLRRHHLSKYNDFGLAPPELPSNFVVVVDQTFGDASVAGARADETDFQRMLQAAVAEHPNATILIKTHPETTAGQRKGYFSAQDETETVLLFSDRISPWALLARAKAVYCVSSQMGMEAIFAGHRPVLFGDAFFAGYGLTDDRHPATKQKTPLTSEQLFHVIYRQYCHWYDPFLDQATDFTRASRCLAVKAQAQRERHRSQVFVGIRLWKRGFMKRYFSGTPKPPVFIDDVGKAVETARRRSADVFVWAGKETPELTQGCAQADLRLWRVEDGFLRSSGLGAQLIEPVSLAFDDKGIYYDPTRENRLEQLITAAVDLPAEALQRAERIRTSMISMGLSKYNLNSVNSVQIPHGRHSVLVPGQVENDQSILKGAGAIASNLAAVERARHLYPDSYLIYKPHPDVVAGLRDGGQAETKIAELADLVIQKADIAILLDQVDTVATITSLTGFEALIRGKEVICFGTPFYAGWGLTTDFGQIPERRIARPDLRGLIHAALVGYPRYWDPVSKLPCPIEVVLDRFARGEVHGDTRRSIRYLAKLQGVFASYAHLWR